MQIPAAFLDTVEALGGDTVDRRLFVHGLFGLADVDGHILQLTEIVGKLHANDIGFAVLAHSRDLSVKTKRTKVFYASHLCPASLS